MKAMTDSDIDQKLKDAQESPESPEAKKLLKLFLPLLRATGPRMPWSPTERDAELYKMYGLFHLYGLPSMLVTVSNNSADSPLVVAVCARKLGEKYDMVELWRS